MIRGVGGRGVAAGGVDYNASLSKSFLAWLDTTNQKRAAAKVSVLQSENFCNQLVTYLTIIII